MSDSKDECKLWEDLWSSFCSVSRFQISGLLIRQASSSAVPAVRWGLARFFDWRSHESGCKGAHSTDTTARTRQHTLLCSAATWQVLTLVSGRRKAARKQVMGLLTTTQGKAEKDHDLAGSSPNQSPFYLLSFFQSLPPSLISE